MFWSKFKKRYSVDAVQIKVPFVIYPDDPRQQKGKPGDYLVRQSDGRHHVIDKKWFEEQYKESMWG